MEYNPISTPTTATKSTDTEESGLETVFCYINPDGFDISEILEDTDS